MTVVRPTPATVITATVMMVMAMARASIVPAKVDRHVWVSLWL
jgi:hypothetical protein